MKKRKIVFFSRAPNLYGAPRCLLSLLSRLDQNRFKAVVVFPDSGPLVDKVKALGIDTWVIPREQPLGKIAYVFKLFSFLRNQKPDLIYVNTVTYASPVIAAKLLGFPIIVHVHGSRKYLSYRVNTYPILKFSDRFICVSKATEKLVLENNVPPHKITVVYNGVNLLDFKPSEEIRSKYRNELGLDNKDILVGHLGQIIERKGIDDFVKAVSLVHKKQKNCRFIIVGEIEGNRYFKSKILPLCQKLNLTDHIIFTGYKQDVSGYLSAIDIFVNASKAEPFALVNLEAMAMGKAIVATDVGGNPEAIVDGKTGSIVPAGSVKHLAEAIINLARNNDQRISFGKAGRERVQSNFTIEKYYQGIEKVLI